MPAIMDKIADALHLHKQHHEQKTEDASTNAAASTAPTPIFDSKVTVIFVLGGPGVGKGTQCASLVDDFGFCHLSAGDLLRAEQAREGSEYGELIRSCIREGQIVPMAVTIKLLENAMRAALETPRAGDAWGGGRGRFLIDGFPRQMDQAEKFDNEVCASSLVLFFTAPEDKMVERLLERGKTSGRDDDNAESIKKRLLVYKEKTMPVIEHYTKQQKVATIDASASVEEVHAKAKDVVERLFAGKIEGNVSV
ncbi:UMP-CMP kinase [Taiwanofungus camphoratus]|nr:UMP-CMP kinase [Antrodia cinnamomea]KAI0948451.1 UMP-CMP kinase [Antrodia cinnamomea]